MLRLARLGQVGRPGRQTLSTMAEGNPIDMKFVMSLMERPIERPVSAKMTPEHWPDISVSSSVFRMSLDDYRMERIEASQEIARKDVDANEDDEFWPLLGESEEAGSLDKMIDSRLSPSRALKESENSLKRIQDMLKVIGGGRKVQERVQGNDRYFSHLEKVSFKDLKKKTIFSVLSKAFDIEEDVLKDENTVQADTGAIKENDIVGEKVEMITPQTILVLSGIDLHLVGHERLKELAKLYGIETQKTLKLLERQFCKYFTTVISDGIPTRRIKHLAGESMEPFTSKKKDGDATAWSKEDDELLMRYTDRVRDASQAIILQVEKYLQEHQCTIPTTVGDEDANLWEVIAQAFSRVTPKACKKRWMLLLRMREMESK